MDVIRHESLVSDELRRRVLRQVGCVLWFTGLSGSGKSTVAHALEQRLVSEGRVAYVLDGDNLRHGLNADLGFSPKDRQENIRRVGEVAALFAQAGLVTLVAFISPYRADRQLARNKVPKDRFIEVFVDAPLDLCATRDPKGLYLKARAGKIAEFTGVTAPYETPDAPEIRLDTTRLPADRCVALVHDYLLDKGFIPRGPAVER